MSKDQVLKLIAEGYYSSSYQDRYILIVNPDFDPTNGSDLFIVYDIVKDKE